MARSTQFVLCTLIFLPVYAGFVDQLWPVVTANEPLWEWDADLIPFSALTILASSGTTAFMFSRDPRARRRR